MVSDEYPSHCKLPMMAAGSPMASPSTISSQVSIWVMMRSGLLSP
jgi:hypothetical protein